LLIIQFNIYIDTRFGVKSRITNADLLEASTKLDALMKALQALDKDTDGKPIKSVVFSQFTSFLDIVQVAFRKAHIKFVRLDGSVRIITIISTEEPLDDDDQA
jgi:SNF2 family DNA or RNA helicase